jgi:hypothetical protein
VEQLVLELQVNYSLILVSTNAIATSTCASNTGNLGLTLGYGAFVTSTCSYISGSSRINYNIIILISFFILIL